MSQERDPLHVFQLNDADPKSYVPTCFPSVMNLALHKDITIVFALRFDPITGLVHPTIALTDISPSKQY